MSYKEKYLNKWYSRVKDFILSLDVDIEDVYVISFLKGNENDDPCYPYIVVDYNTISNYKLQINNASSEGEAKWNYAFWLENELFTIGGMDDSDLRELFEAEGIFYDNNDKMQELFMDIITEISQNLHKDGVLKKKFEKDIPVIIHELEYYELPISWTRRGNPKELILEFEEWYQTEICKN